MHSTPRLTPHARSRSLALGLASVLLLATAAPRLRAQGCVPIKEMGDTSSAIDGVSTSGGGADKWDLGESYEHFRSCLDFVGSQNNTASRNAAGNQVINVVDQFDTAISYSWDARDSVSLDVPYFSATRSQLVKGLGRFRTQSHDLGDMRVGVSRWLLDPATNPRGNISVGVGLSVPTERAT